MTKTMLQTKEFYDLMNQFEKEAKKLISMGSMGLTKENKENWKNQRYYADGNVNNAFKMYQIGYSLGKSESNGH